jgi:hypothetical protein
LVTALEGHVETLKAQLAASEARVTATEVQLAEANAKADQAIAEFCVPAERLAVLAQEGSRPWWRQLRRA